MPSYVSSHAVSSASRLVAYEGFTPTVRHETDAKHFLRGVAFREDPSSEFPGAGFRVYTSEHDLSIPIARVATWDGASSVLLSSFTPATFEGTTGGNNNGMGYDGTNVLLGQNGSLVTGINQYVKYVGDTSTVSSSFTRDDGSTWSGSSCGWHTPDADLLTSQWESGFKNAIHRKHDGFSATILDSYVPTTSGVVGSSRFAVGCDWADSLSGVVYNRQTGGSTYAARRNSGFTATQVDEFTHGIPPNPEWLAAYWLDEGIIAQLEMEFDAIIPFTQSASLSVVQLLAAAGSVVFSQSAALSALVPLLAAGLLEFTGAADLSFLLLTLAAAAAGASLEARVSAEASFEPVVDAGAGASARVGASAKLG